MMDQTNTSEPQSKMTLNDDTHNECRSLGDIWPTCVDDNFEGQGMGADFDTLVHENKQW